MPTCGQRRSPASCRVSPRGPTLPAVWRADPLPRARRREPHGLLVRRLPARPGAHELAEGWAGIVSRVGYLFSWPHARRSFILRFAHSRSARSRTSCASSTTRASRSRSRSRSTTGRTGPRCTSTGRSCATSSRSAPTGSGCRDDALIALEELAREPSAGIYARAHAGREPSEDDALFRTVLVDLLIRVAEACGGFDWDDESFERGVRRARAARSSASAARTRPSRRSSASRPASSASSAASFASGRPRTASWRGTGRRPRAFCRQASAASPTATA